MTCIVAVTDGERVVMGGDSAGAAGTDLMLRSDPKVFRNGEYGVGFTTSFRMGQILRFGAVLPEPPVGASGEELERFLVTELVEAVRDAFEARGFGKRVRTPVEKTGYTEEGQAWGGLFLLGVRGRIFQVRQDFQVASPKAPYSAIGRGAPAALGALHALGPIPALSLEERAERALWAAEAGCTTVRGPFSFIATSQVRNPMALAAGGQASWPGARRSGNRCRWPRTVPRMPSALFPRSCLPHLPAWIPRCRRLRRLEGRCAVPGRRGCGRTPTSSIAWSSMARGR
ncbi:MAG: hypothetical protein KDD47_06035 [Acidobacteria bacterium]|nr:hypothetical protein [Acidobacteriota bacterium]